MGLNKAAKAILNSKVQRILTCMHLLTSENIFIEMELKLLLRKLQEI